MRLTTRTMFAGVALCFLVSGAAGLIYQVVWTRYLALFLGHTSYAVIAILVAFMGGLAAGNGCLGAIADRIRRPLAMYGWLEIGIAAYALLFPSYYSLVHHVYISLARPLEPGGISQSLLKFLFSLATVLCPTVMMGATFPALVRFVTSSLVELRGRVAGLYFINTVGAVFGCLIADFWWIPNLGLQSTVYAGAILNLAAGAVALCIDRFLALKTGSLVSPVESKTVGESFSRQEMSLALVGIGLSGFVAMLYEIAWTRLLALALGSSTHAFSLMLMSFITGLALGAWIIYRCPSTLHSLTAFAWAELFLGMAVLVSMFFYAEVPYLFLYGASFLSRQPATYPLYEILQAVICLSIMLVPTACLGLTLPLASRIATVELARTGRSVGKVFAVNTVGTVLGAIVTGLWLMPWLGLARTFAVGLAINILIGLSILFRTRLNTQLALGSSVGAVGLVLLTGAIFNEQWRLVFSAGLWRSTQPPATRSAFAETVREGKVLYYKDGASSTVTVLSKQRAGKPIYLLKVNGKTDAASAVDITTQLLLGHIPMLLHPSCTNALVVGMGSGMTAAAVARHSSLQKLDLIEISPEVVEASHLFGDYNDRFWENPKIRTTIEDAKSFLKISNTRYDVIISEPSNPWMAGVAGVFSREYYEDCKSHLHQGGIMAQWVQAYETSDDLLDVVSRTFGSVFPCVSIWETSAADLVLIGSATPLRTDIETMRAHFLEPAVSSDLKRIEIVSLPALLSREAISSENGGFVAIKDGPTHSDFRPVLEFEAARAFFAFGRANRWRLLDEKFLTRPTTFLGSYLQKRPLADDDFKALSRFYLEYGLPGPEIFRTLLLRWQRQEPDAVFPIELMTQAPEPVSTAEFEALRLSPMSDFLMNLAEKDSEPLRQYESYLMQSYRAERSVFNQPPSEKLESALKRLLETDPANQRVYRCHLAEIAWDHSDETRFVEWLSGAFSPNVTTSGPANFSADIKAPQFVLLRRIKSLWWNGKLAEARGVCQYVKQQGYIGSDPELDLIYRKVIADPGPGAGPQ